MEKVILSLDTAQLTGWCLIKGSKIIESGVQDLSKTRGESNGMLFLKFRHWLEKILKENNVNLVIYEQSHHRGGAATEIGVNLTGRVQEICAEYQIEYTALHSGTLKKHSTGSGAASKEDMIEAAEKILNRAPLDSNEADAVMLAKYAYDMYG